MTWDQIASGVVVATMSLAIAFKLFVLCRVVVLLLRRGSGK